MANKALEVLKKVGLTLAPMAPWIAGALGGPFAGAAADKAMQALSLVSKPDATTADKIQAIGDVIAQGQLTPEQSLALKEADQKFQSTMTQAGFDHIEKMTALANQDVADARAMSEKTGSKVPITVALLVMLSFLGMCWYLISGHFPLHDAPAAGFAGTVLGYIISEAKVVSQWLFGAGANNASGQ